MEASAMVSSKTVLITGGAGFIGSHLVDRLINQNYKVRVIDNLSAGCLNNLGSHLRDGTVEFIQGDIRDFSLIRKCVENVDSVVHLAAQTSVPYSLLKPDFTFDVNVSGSLNLMQASIEAGVRRFVFASSCAVFGDTQTVPIDENIALKPISPYAESKLAIERCCRGFNQRGLLGSVVLRFFNVYGPRQGLSEYSGVITQFINRLRMGSPLVVFGDGTQTRDFVSVFDVVEGIVLAMEKQGVEGEAFNIGSGYATSIEDLAKAVLDLAGSDLGIEHRAARLGDIVASVADISKAKRVLEFEPKIGLFEGLRPLVNGL
jgi:UDP-glucose 4-epimerase